MMRSFSRLGTSITVGMLLFLANQAVAQRQMEKLDRGVVAVCRGQGGVYVGWRLLGTEPDGVAFSVYRNDVRINTEPITDSTNFVDENGDLNAVYTVRPVIDGAGGEASAPVRVWRQNYLSIALQTPEGYTPNDASVGDLDGDGVYDIVLHQAGRGRDNASRGTTDPPVLEAYRLDGTLLWRINLGRNIREGAHYTQFMVYDLDGDGKAEVACKTADGTVDGQGVTIGDAEANWINADGKILAGPEFFTIFDGQTGAVLATADYIPPRGEVGGWGGVGGNGNNDRSGNRVDRFLACVAYLDGTRIAKWDWDNGLEVPLFTAEDCSSNNGSKSTPVLSADLLGDWREEVLWRSRDNKELRLYTTTIPTRYQFCSLMHDPRYRLSIAWQNVAYNQPPHVGFYLGVGMATPPRPNITLVGRGK